MAFLSTRIPLLFFPSYTLLRISLLFILTFAKGNVRRPCPIHSLVLLFLTSSSLHLSDEDGEDANNKLKGSWKRTDRAALFSSSESYEFFIFQSFSLMKWVFQGDTSLEVFGLTFSVRPFKHCVPKSNGFIGSRACVRACVRAGWHLHVIALCRSFFQPTLFLYLQRIEQNSGSSHLWDHSGGWLQWRRWAALTHTHTHTHTDSSRSETAALRPV